VVIISAPEPCKPSPTLIEEVHYNANYVAKYALTDVLNAGGTEVMYTFWLGRNWRKGEYFTIGILNI
jgi:hypothetical protein